MAKVKALRTLTTTREIQDLKGWTIRKGARLGVIKQAPKHPTKNYRILVVRVDNGTVGDERDWSLCPETEIRFEEGKI